MAAVGHAKTGARCGVRGVIPICHHQSMSWLKNETIFPGVATGLQGLQSEIRNHAVLWHTTHGANFNAAKRVELWTEAACLSNPKLVGVHAHAIVSPIDLNAAETWSSSLPVQCLAPQPTTASRSKYHNQTNCSQAVCLLKAVTTTSMIVTHSGSL